jgi:hypothetical protein
MELFILYEGRYNYDGGKTVLDIYQNEQDAIAMLDGIATHNNYTKDYVYDLPYCGSYSYNDQEGNRWFYVEKITTGKTLEIIAANL